MDYLDALAERILRATSQIQHSKTPFPHTELPDTFVRGQDLLVPRDFIAIAFSLLALAAVHAVLHRFVFQPLAVRFCVAEPPKQKSPKTVHKEVSSQNSGKSTDSLISQPETTANEALELTQQKFTTTCWKLLIYTVLFLMGCYALLADNVLFRLQSGDPDSKGWIGRGIVANYQDWPGLRIRNISFVDYKVSTHGQSFMDTLSVWAEDLAGAFGSMFAGPDDVKHSYGKHLYALVPASPILWHYHLVLGHYFYATLMLLTNVEGPKQKDKVQMLTHHIVTILLVFFSWYSKLFRAGTLVLILHDLSDPFMEVAKLMLYTGRQTLANIWFAGFALIFIVSRCVVFPTVLAWPTISFLLSEEGQQKAHEIPFWYAPVMGLCLLQVLHIFWSGLIINMVVDALTKGEVGGDIRDNENESDKKAKKRK